MTEHAAPRPSDAVLRAFGVASVPLERLPGGQGQTWRAGQVVFRPHGDAQEARWRSDTLARLEHTVVFRTPRPVAATGGGWLVDGWEAWEWLPGATDPTRVDDVIAAGAAFHRALVGLPRPGFLDDVGGPWAEADRLVWHGVLPADPTLDRLARSFRPVVSPSQLIHGDLLGNVLFVHGQPPAVFDWAPYWRPAGLGAAIAAVDAVCWHGVSIERLEALGTGVPEWSQLLVRALAFRIATLHLLGAWDRAQADHHRPVVDALVQGAAGTLVVS
ncbi:hypothetical protein ASG04_13930 [Curtobacterium sp. Leaf183]|uniref:hypothetical protein n=1 Tax=Curtobacterium sp. Leaf183 TaxID=1736291 RepID=UPI0006F8B1D2|nr:hypothetical protein [Curtobacterium sp. Leaf183]KQS08210.1 hypothetical protein ASG04_13930 [Curtobacterium sp. Leaf183]